MPYLAMRLGAAVESVRGFAHVRAPTDWWDAHRAMLGLREGEDSAALVRRSARGRQLTSITCERLPGSDRQDVIHLEYSAWRSAEPATPIRGADREYDQAAPVLAGITGPESQWSVVVNLRYPRETSSLLALPSPFVVGAISEIRGFRLAGNSEDLGSFDVIIERPRDLLFHHVMFKDIGALDEGRVRRWLDRSQVLSRGFVANQRATRA